LTQTKDSTKRWKIGILGFWNWLFQNCFLKNLEVETDFSFLKGLIFKFHTDPTQHKKFISGASTVFFCWSWNGFILFHFRIILLHQFLLLEKHWKFFELQWNYYFPFHNRRIEKVKNFNLLLFLHNRLVLKKKWSIRAAVLFRKAVPWNRDSLRTYFSMHFFFQDWEVLLFHPKRWQWALPS